MRYSTVVSLWVERSDTVITAYLASGETIAVPAARAELDAYLRENLYIPVITEMEDSLWSGVYLYGTDNHLSAQGAALRTEELCTALRMYLEKDGHAE